MSELVSFRVFLNEVLTAAAFEIFGAVEKMLVECMKKNIPRSYMKQHELDSLQFPISEEEVPPEQQDWTPSLGQFPISEGDDPLHKAQLTEYPALSPLNASKLQMFSRFLDNLLTTSAAQEISGSVEKILVKYREENDRLGRMLRLTPEIKLCRIDSLQFSLSVSEEEVSPEPQDCSPTLRKENPEPTQIKEEQEELRISKREEHDQGVEPNIIEFIFSPSVKRELSPVTNLKNLNQLKPFHTGEKSFGCGNCEKSFSQTGTLTKHKPTHTGEKSHSSGDCGKSFCNKGTVTQYKLTHKREKPFSCDDCGKSFSLKWTLTQHKMTHTGEKPFICADCGKRFRQRGTLTKHKLTHTGEKPFCCGDCGKSFMYRHHLKQHEQTHTGEKPFCCGDCGKSFMYKHHLKKHKLTHTGEK